MSGSSGNTTSQSVDEESQSHCGDCGDRQNQPPLPHAPTLLLILFRLNDPYFHGGQDLPCIRAVPHVLKVVRPVLTRMFQQDADPTRMLIRVLRHLRRQKISLPNAVLVSVTSTDIIDIAVNDDPEGLVVVVTGDFGQGEDGL